MNKWPYVDCQGLAGAWTLGTIQTGGFELVHRASLQGGFGDIIVEDNREFLGTDWVQDPSGASHEWEPQQAAYLNGTPPCSGFSLLNVSAAADRKRGGDGGKNKRGIDSAINDCMKELVRYAGRCTGSDGLPGPEIVSFESVQGAGKEGRPLMQYLRTLLEDITGQKYSLSHVFMSGASIGAAQMRHRYYVNFHRVPFGVDTPEMRRVVTYDDAIGDLQGLDWTTWDAQAVSYNPKQDWWLDEQKMLSRDSWDDLYHVDAHITYDDRVPSRDAILNELVPLWEPGNNTTQPLRAYAELHGGLPPHLAKWWDAENDRAKGFSGPARIRSDKPGYVLTGGGIGTFIHWSEPRFLTVRETARLMGYPDAWSFKVASGINQCSMWIGKCCPVQSGRWVADWVLRSLNGEPGSAMEEIGEREFVHNSTLLYTKWLKEQQTTEGAQ